MTSPVSDITQILKGTTTKKIVHASFVVLVNGNFALKVVLTRASMHDGVKIQHLTSGDYWRGQNRRKAIGGQGDTNATLTTRMIR